MQRIVIKGYCRKSSIGKDGKSSIAIIIRAGRSGKCFILLRNRCKPNDFDNSVGYAKSGANMYQINNEINHVINKLNGIREELDKQHINYTPKDLKDKYTIGTTSHDFYTYAINKLKVIGNKLAAKTYEDYRYCLDQLHKHTYNLQINEINEAWLAKYLEGYMLNTRGRSRNGIYHDYATIRKFYRLAMKDVLASEDPFINYQWKKEKADIKFLKPQQLLKLKNLLTSGELNDSVRLYKICFYFLFSCMTGLRFSDVVKLSKQVCKNRSLINKIKQNGIELKTSKSREKKTARIPAFKALQEFVDYWPTTHQQVRHNRTNEGLRELLALAGIKEKVTFHSSRHSFAVLALKNGVHQKQLQQWLTHSSIVTSDIYMHIIDEMESKEAAKLDNML